MLLMMACHEDLSMTRYVPRLIAWAFLFLGSAASNAATINAASCSEANVASAISSAAVGDTVQVPAGSCTWSSLSIAKAVTIKGAGIGVTNITLGTGNSVTKQAAGIIRIRDFSFSKSGGGNESKGFEVGGSWLSAQPVVIQNNAFTISGSGLFKLNVNGGVIIAGNAFTGDWDDSFIQPKGGDPSSWTTADTMGTRDTTGTANHYIENNTFYGGTNQGIDCDDNSRCVYRYNTLTYSSFNSHGWDTSPEGVRHFEVYNNTFIHDGGTTAIANQNWVVWIRGGTGVIFNNQIADIAGSYWGDKAELHFSIRGAEDSRPQGSCANVSYPVPRQLGQNHNGTSYFTDPIYIWGNTGATVTDANWNWGNPCGFTWSTFFQWGRDAINTGTAKPGYTAYAYPHPLLAEGPPDTENPTTPTSPSVNCVSATQCNVSWTASTDNVGIAGYDVQRCAGAACTPTGAVYQTSGTGTTYASTGLSGSTLYRYHVRGRDAAGNVSSYSTVAQDTTDAAVTYTVTPSAGANGSISPNTPQTVTSGNTQQFSVTANATYEATVAGTCGGSPSTGTGTFTYTTSAITGNCTVSATFAVQAGPPALPEGPGLAAAYPNDSGITGHGSVLFADGFETYTSNGQLTSSGNWSNYYQGSNLLLDTTTFFSGAKSLRIRMPSSGVEVSNAIVRPISPSRDKIHLRVYARYQSGYSGMNSAHNGIRITANYSGPGTIPNGSDFFYVSVEDSRYQGETQPGYTNAYVYFPEQDDAYGEHWYPSGLTSNGAGPNGGFGAYFVARTNLAPPTGQWIAYEVMVHANTAGLRDGRIAVWKNGTLVADWQNIRFRDVSTVKINEIQLENGGQGSTQQNDKWYDNVVIATEYIGPMSSFLPAPTNLRWYPR